MMVQGFRFAGLHAGIKPAKKDLALIVSDVPASGRRLLHHQPCPGRAGARTPSPVCPRPACGPS